MAEINHQFTAGRMNKDLDERLVPNGEYRDALNVEVSTSEGSAVGTVQTLWGNKLIGTSAADSKLKCIGSVTWPKENKVYWLATTAKGETSKFDYIYEYDVDEDTVNIVFQEKYGFVTSPDGSVLQTGPFIQVADASGVTVGTTMSVYDPATGLTQSTTVMNVQEAGPSSGFPNWLIQTSGSIYTPVNSTITFEVKNRTLGFDEDYLITGINILDGLMFWTDDNTEPKKINIERCKYGSLPANLVNGCTSLWVQGINKGKMLEEHVTMIKKSPVQPPVLSMQNSERGLGQFNVQTHALMTYIFEDSSGERLMAGAESDGINIPHIVIGGATFNLIGNSWQIGDVLEITYFDSSYDFSEEVVARIAIKDIVASTGGGALQGADIHFEILSISADIITRQPGGDLAMWFKAQLEQSSPLFEFKFPRFAYRWKYEDGEYSCISPFSEVAFIPEEFDYYPKKGFNLGMTNNLRFLVISKFLPNDEKCKTPLDVVEVDVLYKESNSPNVYSVKTIKGPSAYNSVLGTENSDQDKEWDGLVQIGSPASGIADSYQYYPAGDKATYPLLAENAIWDKTPEGSIKIESELIHAAVPANQMLRPYDNVPRKALAQELTGNRIIYGNYLQQYNIVSNNGKRITPKFQVSLGTRKHRYGSFGGEAPVNYNPTLDPASSTGLLNASSTGWAQITSDPKKPEKSIKSLRKYQIGIVYMDKYGRQTPILTDDSATIKVEKKDAINYNYINVRMDDGTFQAPNYPSYPHWATHYKYFIKETSNEYYNLAMDRFYPAEDGNVWLSFPSSERNKVDEETFLILKKQHDTDTPVIDEDARYKILAIKNEAPTFVKTQQRSMGATVIVFGGAGSPYEGAMHIDIKQSDWNDNWGDNFGNGDDPDQLVFRMSKDEQYSRWYTVAGRSTVNGYVRLKSSEVFRHDVHMLVDDPTANPLVYKAGIKLELANQVVTQLPEFEGRFFVKIFRDITLEQNILKKDVVPRYNPTIIQGIQRIRARRWSEKTHKDVWENASSNKDRRGLFLDESSCMGFYKSGYSWKGKGDPAGGDVGTGPGIDNPHMVNPNSTPSGRYYSNANNQWGDNIVSNTHIRGSCGGLHPTGIGMFNTGLHEYADSDVAADAMMVSYSHLSPAGSSFPGMSGSSAPSTNEKNFWEAMKTTGTRFRWQGDTNVYEVRGDAVGKATPKEMAIFNYDNYNQNWNNAYRDAGNKRRRLIIRFHPPMPKNNGVEWELPGGQTQIMTNYDPRKHLEPGDGDTWSSSWSGCSGKNCGEKRYIEILETDYDEMGDFTSDNPAIWETEPKEDVGLDLYYEASPAYPVGEGHYYYGSWNILGWYNCYSFANGVESNRIRDDYNTVQIDKGPKVSMPLAEQYMEERKWSGLIFSGIYNSTSSVNRLNQFIQAENITKDLQPAYGSIQKLHSRSTADGDLIALCEDKVMKVLANKDALYNADGNTNVTANTNVLGQAIPYTGEYGISRNPESFAYDAYRAYFTDKDRGAVLRLSQDGLTPISDAGMKDYFHDHLKPKLKSLIGSFDARKKMYHISIERDSGIETSDTSVYIPPGGLVPVVHGIAGNGGRGLQLLGGTTATNNIFPDLGTWDIFAQNKQLDPGDVGFYDTDGKYVTSPGDVYNILWNKQDANGGNAATGSGTSISWYEMFLNIPNGAGSYANSGLPATPKGPEFMTTHDIYVQISSEYDPINNPTNTVAVFKVLGSPHTQDTSYIVPWTKLAGGNDTYISNHIAEAAYIRCTVQHVYGNMDLHKHVVESRIWAVPKANLDYINRTVSYSERVGGWVSFKTWLQESGCSINNKYYTFKSGSMWEHYVGDTIATYYPNSSYEVYEEPSVTVLLNDSPSSVKTFSTLNYEGSQNKFAKNVNPLNNQYYNLAAQDGWYCSDVITNLETGFLNEFIEKEGKYFNFLKDDKSNTLANLDEEQFNTQGIGQPSSVSGGNAQTAGITINTTIYNP